MGSVTEVAEQKRLEIPWIRSLGSALGAVSAAVLLSTLGAAGTLIGAAVGSLCITVGGAVYAHSLELTKERAAKAHAVAVRRVTRTRSGATAAAHQRSEEDLQERSDGFAASNRADEAGRGTYSASRPSVGESLRGLRWRRIIVTTGGVFAVAMGIILAFELSAGRAVSTFTGGSSDTAAAATSIPGFSGLSDGEAGADEQDQQEPGTEQDEAPVPDDADPTTDQDEAPGDGEGSVPSEMAPVPETTPEQPAEPAEPQQ